MQWMWSQGDYARLALWLEPHAEVLAAVCGMRPALKALDVGAGNGNFALAASRRGATVTASDVTPRMVELGRARSAAEHAPINWVEGDAEALPFDEASFDVVASVFGAMFAPTPERVASELFRVLTPGGLVAMANYSSRGFLGRLAALAATFSPPASVEMPSPFLWADPDEVRRRFRGLASSIDTAPRTLTFEFESFERWLEFWEQTNPRQIAFKTILPPEVYRQLLIEMGRLVKEWNREKEGRVVLDSTYIQVLARK